MNFKIDIDYALLFKHMQHDLVREIARRAPQYDMDLIASLAPQITSEGTPVLEILGEHYAIYLERGNIPFVSDDTDKLKRWCKDKLGNENAWYMVFQHIKKQGVRPQKFMTQTLNEEITLIIAKALQQPGVVKMYIKE